MVVSLNSRLERNTEEEEEEEHKVRRLRHAQHLLHAFNVRTTTSQKCEVVPRRARVDGCITQL